MRGKEGGDQGEDDTSIGTLIATCVGGVEEQTVRLHGRGPEWSGDGVVQNQKRQ